MDSLLFKKLARLAATGRPDGSGTDTKEDTGQSAAILSGSPLTRGQWEELFKEASRHCILGILFDAVDKLPDGMRPPLAVYSRWALACEKIEASYNLRKEKSEELSNIFADAGFRSCILKGTSVARYYPRPSARQCGDIDIWVEGKRKEILSFLNGRCGVGEVVYHHCDARFYKKLEVEVHFTPSWFYGFRRNLLVQKYFSGQSEEQFSSSVTSIRFDLVFCLIHIYRHLLFEGVGLRQVFDYYWILRSAFDKGPDVAEGLAETDALRKEAMSIADALGMRRFTGALMYVMQEYLGLPESCLLCPGNEKYGRLVLNEILTAGNFGRKDLRGAVSSSSDTRWGRFLKRLFHLLRFIPLAPMEVLSAPFFKTWQYFWRLKNNYLRPLQRKG